MLKNIKYLCVGGYALIDLNKAFFFLSMLLFTNDRVNFQGRMSDLWSYSLWKLILTAVKCYSSIYHTQVVNYKLLCMEQKLRCAEYTCISDSRAL